MHKIINRFIDELIIKSTPEAPFWNIENIKWNKPPKWNYIDGCMLTSLIALYKQTNNSRYLDFIITFVDYYVFEDGTIRGYDPLHYSTDDLSPSRILFDLYDFTKNDKYLKAIHHSYTQIKSHPRTNAGSFWHKKIYHDQVWLDGIYMMQPFYTRYETRYNSKKNYFDIVKQFKNIRKFMFDENKKLYYHAYDESKTLFWADKKTGLSKNFWLRAIGWYLAGTIDVLEYMEDDENKTYLSNLFKEAVDGLLQYQEYETKMFYQVVDQEKSDKNYLETSGSLLTAYAILKGSRLGFLSSEYSEKGKEIFHGVCKNKLTEEDGDLNLVDICLVAGLGPENNLRRDGTYDYYMSEPIVKNDAKGVGPLIMAYVEILSIK